MSGLRSLARCLLVAVTLGFALGAASFQVAAATSDQPPVPTTGTQVESTLFHVPSSTVMYVTALLLPLLGGLVMRWVKNNNARVGIMLVLNAINALFATATTEGGDAIFSASLINNFIISTVISLGVLFGIYKKLDVKGASVDTHLKGEAAPAA